MRSPDDISENLKLALKMAARACEAGYAVVRSRLTPSRLSFKERLMLARGTRRMNRVSVRALQDCKRDLARMTHDPRVRLARQQSVKHAIEHPYPNPIVRRQTPRDLARKHFE